MEELKSPLTLNQPLVFTPNAIQEFKRLMKIEENSAKKGLRVGVKGGGCAGFSYIIAFDDPQDQDETFMIDSILVMVDPSHQIYLQGTEVDFENGLNNRGFIFKNPNAETTCGCGSSFG